MALMTFYHTTDTITPLLPQEQRSTLSKTPRGSFMSQYGYEDRQVSTSAAGVASSSTTRTPSKKACKHDEIVTAWILYVQ